MGVAPADAEVAAEVDALCRVWGVRTVGKQDSRGGWTSARARRAMSFVMAYSVLKEGRRRCVVAFPPAYCSTAASPRAFTAS